MVIIKQPNIRIFGETYKVMLIEYNMDGHIDRIVYQRSEYSRGTIFRSDSVMVDNSMTKLRTIKEPTRHPHHDYLLAPDLESYLS